MTLDEATEKVAADLRAAIGGPRIAIALRHGATSFLEAALALADRVIAFAETLDPTPAPVMRFDDEDPCPHPDALCTRCGAAPGEHCREMGQPRSEA